MDFGFFQNKNFHAIANGLGWLGQIYITNSDLP